MIKRDATTSPEPQSDARTPIGGRALTVNKEDRTFDHDSPGGDMVFGKLRDYEVANSLGRPEYQVWRTLSDRDRRAKIVIGVVDDKPFSPRENLENTGYNIKILGDPQSISVVEGCHIVLCDLLDVGTALNPHKQGAFLIDEIKLNYPEKIVGAYTGGGMKNAISREAFQRSDFFMKKDATTDEWRDKLDSCILQLLDPVEVWDRQRNTLVQKRIDTFTILKLEDAFVRSIKAKEDVHYSLFSRAVESAPGDVRAIMQSLIASGIYSLLTGH